MLRRDLEQRYRGQEAHIVIIKSVEEGVKKGPIGELLGTYSLASYVDRLLGVLYEDLPEDPEIVEDRIHGLETKGFHEGPFISDELEKMAYCINTANRARTVPIEEFYRKHHQQNILSVA